FEQLFEGLRKPSFLFILLCAVATARGGLVDLLGETAAQHLGHRSVFRFHSYIWKSAFCAEGDGQPSPSIEQITDHFIFALKFLGNARRENQQPIPLCRPVEPDPARSRDRVVGSDE